MVLERDALDRVTLFCQEARVAKVGFRGRLWRGLGSSVSGANGDGAAPTPQLTHLGILVVPLPITLALPLALARAVPLVPWTTGIPVPPFAVADVGLALLRRPRAAVVTLAIPPSW